MNSSERFDSERLMFAPEVGQLKIKVHKENPWGNAGVLYLGCNPVVVYICQKNIQVFT